MRRIFCLLSVLAMLFALCSCDNSNDSHIDRHDLKRGNQIGDLCPTATLTAIDEGGYTAHTFDPTATGKITVINFWAYWCPPCVNELPHFDRVAKEYADEVEIIAVHCDAVEQAQSFIANNYPDSEILFAMDKGRDAFAYYSACGGGTSIPYTVVLDASGVIRKTFVGAINYDKLVAAIEGCR